MKAISLTLSVMIFQRNVFFFIYRLKSMSEGVTFSVNDPCKPGMQVRKPWCLLNSQWVGLGNPVGGTYFRKRSITDIKFISSQK
jgi:hypothetical protein